MDAKANWIATAQDAQRSSAPRWLLLLLAAYFTVHVIVRLILPDTLGLDEAEQVFRLQWLNAGYGAQPPFYNWLQYLVFSVAGVSVATLVVVKNMLLFASYILCALTAGLLLRDRMLIAVATLGLLTVPQVAYEMQRDLTHTVAVFFAASMFIYGFFLTAKRPSAASYAITGIAIGIGLLSKYNFVLLPAAAFLAAMSDNTMRIRVLDRKLLITILITIALTLPHALWLTRHLAAASERTLGKLHENEAASYPLQILTGTSSFALAIMGFSIVTVAVFLISFRKPLFVSMRVSSWEILLIERILLFAALGIIVLIVVGGVTNLKDRWLVPFLFVVPLYLCMKLEALGRVPNDRIRRFLAVAFFIMLAMPVAMFTPTALAGLTHHYERGNVPYGRLSESLSKDGDPQLVIVDNDWIGGNLALHFPNATVVSPTYPPYDVPLDVAGHRSILVVWNVGKEKIAAAMPAPLAEWLSAKQLKATAPSTYVDVPYLYASEGDTYRFGYAWLTTDPHTAVIP